MSKRTIAAEETTDESPRRPVPTGIDAAIAALEAAGVENVKTANEQGAALVNDRVHIFGGTDWKQ